MVLLLVFPKQNVKKLLKKAVKKNSSTDPQMGFSPKDLKTVNP
jgi:hypothetical protein